MSNPKIFLLDAHGICYRAFYAVKALANSKVFKIGLLGRIS